MAPPDAGFAARLAALSKGASEAARVCRPLAAAGYRWPSARKTDSEPPYELRPGTGRRGPQELWRRFDRAVTQMTAIAAGDDLLEVAGAYEELAQAAHDLAEAVEQEDRARTTGAPPAQDEQHRRPRRDLLQDCSGAAIGVPMPSHTEGRRSPSRRL